MKASFAILLHAVVISLARTGSVQTCLSVYPNKVVEAYTNWPFRIDCSHLEKEWKKMTDTNSEQLKCMVDYNGKAYDEGIFELSSIEEDNVYRVKLVANVSRCLTSEVVVQLRPFPDDVCSKVVNDMAEEGEMKFLESTIGDRVVLRCIPPDGTPTLIPEGSNREDFKTHWYTQCTNGEYRYNNLWKNVPDPDGYPDKLQMTRVDFYDATNFTCSVTYRGRTLFPITYGQCIKQNVGWKQPSISCINVERASKDRFTTLDCTGQIATGTTSSDDFIVEWIKDEKVICQNSFFNQPTPGVFSKLTSCEVRGNNDSLKCVADSDIDDSEIQRSGKKLQLSLNLRELKDSDYGQYSVSIKYRDGDVWLEDTWSNIVIQDPSPSRDGVAITTAFIVMTPVALTVFIALAVKIISFFQ